jgi:hypothetical protein
VPPTAYYDTHRTWPGKELPADDIAVAGIRHLPASSTQKPEIQKCILFESGQYH